MNKSVIKLGFFLIFWHTCNTCSFCQSTNEFSDIENKDNQESPVKQQISFSTDLGLIYTAENSSFNRAFENSISASDAPFSLKVQNFAIYKAQFADIIQFQFSYGILMNSQPARPFEKTLEQVGIPYDQLHQNGNLAFLKAYPGNFQLTFTHQSGWLIETGLINMNYGNSMLLNPVNYLLKYVDAPEDRMRFNDPNPGAFSFPAIITGFVFPKNSIMIGVIPRVRQYCADFVREWIYQKTHNSLAFLRSSHDIGNTSLKTYSFIDQAHPEDYSKYYTGFGLELDAQAFSFGTLSAQGIISNGTVRLINSREKPDSAVSDTGSIVSRFAITATFNLPFALSSVSCGYYYNRAGYSSKESTWFFSGLGEGLKTGNQLWFNYFSKYSPLDLRRHYVFAIFSLPVFSEYLDLSALAVLCLEDRSLMLFAQNNFAISDVLTISVRDNLIFGDKKSAFGFTPYKNSLSLIASVSF